MTAVGTAAEIGDVAQSAQTGNDTYTELGAGAGNAFAVTSLTFSAKVSGKSLYKVDLIGQGTTASGAQTRFGCANGGGPNTNWEIMLYRNGAEVCRQRLPSNGTTIGDYAYLPGISLVDPSPVEGTHTYAIYAILSTGGSSLLVFQVKALGYEI